MVSHTDNLIVANWGITEFCDLTPAAIARHRLNVDFVFLK